MICYIFNTIPFKISYFYYIEKNCFFGRNCRTLYMFHIFLLEYYKFLKYFFKYKFNVLSNF